MKGVEPNQNVLTFAFDGGAITIELFIFYAIITPFVESMANSSTYS